MMLNSVDTTTTPIVGGHFTSAVQMSFGDLTFAKNIYPTVHKSMLNTVTYALAYMIPVSPIFDRTTILNFRCNEKNRILHDHEELVCAIENKDKQKCADIAHLHMTRYTENIPSMKKMFPEYFK